MSDSISDITKLTWKTKFSYINKMTALMIEVNNTSFIRSSVSITRSAVEGGGATAVGRKPYLISKEYVLPGEKYDYLAMMETDFPLGENNAWVAQRKPYESKDYNLMLKGEVSVSTTSNTEYSDTEIYSSNASMMQVVSVINKGETTTAMVVASLAASGAYYVYAKDSFGNIISFKISTEIGVIYNYDYGMYYTVNDLINGETIPYSTFTVSPNQFLSPTLASYVSHMTSVKNSDGYVRNYDWTLILNDGTYLISCSAVFSYVSLSFQKIETTYIGVVPNVGTQPQTHEYNDRTSVGGILERRYNYTDWYKFSMVGLSIVVSNTMSLYIFNSGVQSFENTGQYNHLQYLNSSYYVYKAANYFNGNSYGSFSYSGVWDGSAFAFEILGYGDDVQFGYV